VAHSRRVSKIGAAVVSGRMIHPASRGFRVAGQRDVAGEVALHSEHGRRFSRREDCHPVRNVSGNIFITEANTLRA
jgi:hypothetical protein